MVVSAPSRAKAVRGFVGTNPVFIIPCPKCLATIGRPCKTFSLTRYGKAAKRSHVPRTVKTIAAAENQIEVAISAN